MQGLISNLIRPFRFSYSIFDLGKRITDNYTRDDGKLFNERGMKIQYSYYANISNRKSESELSHRNDTIHEQNSQICIVYAHCNSGSRIEGLPLLDYVISEGWNLCLFDFTGSGLSDGDYVSLGYYEAADLQTVVTMIKAKKNDKIFLWGRSMGAATIICYLSQTKQIDSIIGCVLDSPYSNLWRLICEFGKSRVNLPEFILEQVVELLRKKIQKDHTFDLKSLDLTSKIKNISTPTMFITSTKDSFITSKHVTELYKQLNSRIKVLEYIDKEHNSPRQSDILKIGISFIKRCLFEKQKMRKQMKYLPKKKQYLHKVNGGNIADMIINNEKKFLATKIFGVNQLKKYHDVSQENLQNQYLIPLLTEGAIHQNSKGPIKRFHSFSHIGLKKKAKTDETLQKNISQQYNRTQNINLKNVCKAAEKPSVKIKKNSSKQQPKVRYRKQKQNNLHEPHQPDNQLSSTPFKSVNSCLEQHYNPMVNKIKKQSKQNKFIKSSIISINLKKSQQSSITDQNKGYSNHYSHENTFLEDSCDSTTFNYLVTSRFRREIENEPKNHQYYWQQSQKNTMPVDIPKSTRTSRIDFLQLQKESEKQKHFEDKRNRIKTDISTNEIQQQNKKRNTNYVDLRNMKGNKKQKDKNLKQILGVLLPAKKNKNQVQKSSQILKLDTNYQKLINHKKKSENWSQDTSFQNTRVEYSPRFGEKDHSEIKGVPLVKTRSYHINYLGKENTTNNILRNQEKSATPTQKKKSNIIKIKLEKQPHKNQQQLREVNMHLGGPDEKIKKIKVKSPLCRPQIEK